MKQLMQQSYNLSYVLTKLSVLTNNKTLYTEEEAIQIQKALTQYKNINEKMSVLFNEFNQSLVDTIKSQTAQEISTCINDITEESNESVTNPEPKLFMVSISETMELHIKSLKKNKEPIPKGFNFFVKHLVIKAISINHAIKIAQNRVDDAITTNDYNVKELTLPDFLKEYAIDEYCKSDIEDKLSSNNSVIYTKILD